ncbi:class I SAM-dependent methyltransferase [Bdellovibrionota bacterium]
MENQFKDFFYNKEHRKIDKWGHYFDVYERHFSKYKNKDVHILEIGLMHGGSLQMWRDYFGENAFIYGVDIDERCKKFETKNTKVFIGDQEDRSFLNYLKDQIPKVDIVIDDGGHTMRQQINTFEVLYPHVSENGIYLCEDTHTSYWKRWGGGYGNRKTFIEHTKHLIDKLNAWHIENTECKNWRKIKVDDFCKTTNSMHFYDSIVVIEKERREKPKSIQIGQIVFEE